MQSLQKSTQPNDFQHPRMKFSVRYNKLLSVVEARNESHAGKIFKKLHGIQGICACKFIIRELK